MNVRYFLVTFSPQTTFWVVDEFLKCDFSIESYWAVQPLSYLQSVTIQGKATEQYFPVVLFILL